MRERVCVKVSAKTPASQRVARRNQLLNGGNVKRHRAAALPADSHHNAAPLLKESRCAIMMLTAGGWGYYW